MKRFFASLLVVVMMLGLLTGCIRIERGEKPEGLNSSENSGNSSGNKPEASSDASSDVSSGGTSEKDPFEPRKVTLEYVRNYRGLYLLKEDGTIYTLSSAVLGMEKGEYDYGLYCEEDGIGYLKLSLHMSSLGEVPPLVVEKNDRVLYYPYNTNVDPDKIIFFCKATRIGYTIPFSRQWDGENLCYIAGDSCLDIIEYDANDGVGIEVTDLDGNSVDELGVLNYNREYIVSWYTGGQHNERRLRANCPLWEFDERSEVLASKVVFDGNECTEFDLSGLSPGIYLSGLMGGLIEIK